MIESTLTFFTIWGIGFWLLTILVSVVFIVNEENLSTLSILATLLLISIYHDSLFILFSNPMLLLIFFIGWVVIGILWSCWRWNIFVGKIVKFHNKSNQRLHLYEIEISNNKSRIINWIIFWPWSMLWNLTGDFFQSVFETMENIYKKISDRQLKKLKQSIEKVD